MAIWPCGCFRIEGKKTAKSFFYVKNPSHFFFLLFFLILEHKKGEQILYLSYFDKFYFNVGSCIPKRAHNFQPSILKQ